MLFYQYQQVLNNGNSDNDDELDPTIENLVEQMVDHDDHEELTELQEAANRDQQKDSTYDLLNNIDLESEIILPMHLRFGPTLYIKAVAPSYKINPCFLIDAPLTH
jgi:hypothetical protein